MDDISLRNMPVGIFKIDDRKHITYVNKYFCKISRYPKSQLIGAKWLSKIHPEDQQYFTFSESNMKAGHPYKFQFRFIDRNKEEVWVLCQIVPEKRRKNTIYYLGIITDISELKQTQAALQKLARFDPLTKLPNRYQFEDLLIKSLERAKRNGNTLALFYIDVDFFKNVNDSLGNSVGDKFLKEIGTRLKESVRLEDVIMRLGGDEFAIIFEDIHNISAISIAAQRLLDDFNHPFFVGESEIRSSISIGISVFPDEETTVETIVQHADQALYDAKQSGRNCYKYYNKKMQKKLERYMLIVEHLRSAIEENQFELYYQPKIEAQTDLLVGLEALIRWNTPFVTNPSPSEFITIAEETGLMPKIGDWVIQTALNQYKKWFENMTKMKEVVISINISPSQLNESRVIERITTILKETDIPTQNILFELTETAVMKKSLDSKSMLYTLLVELGIGLSIDDFGTGYSSLTYLKQLPIKELKIDKSFIDDIGINKSVEVIIKAIINLAITLDLEVIAEGVETQEQLNFLKKNKCTIIQGYYYSKPLSASEMTAYIKAMPTKCS